jgi:hypothetical protein
VKDGVKLEVLPRKEEPEKIEFESKDDESNFTKEKDSKEEAPHTPILRGLVQE